MTDATSKTSASAATNGDIESSVKDNKRDAAKVSEQNAAEELADEDEDDEEDEDFVRTPPPLQLFPLLLRKYFFLTSRMETEPFLCFFLRGVLTGGG